MQTAMLLALASIVPLPRAGAALTASMMPTPTPTTASTTATATPTSHRPLAIAKGKAAPNPATAGGVVRLLDDRSSGGTFSWCPSDRFDPATLSCVQCADPCADLLTAGVPPARAPAASSGQRVSGHVSAGNFCSSDASALGVGLMPTGRVTTTDAGGRFVFDGVANGEYVLTFGTLAFLALAVDGRDESVQFCLDCPSALRVEPRHGPAGSIATAVGGGCYALHSGRFGTITFDDVVVGRGGGSQSGDFHTRILVPPDALPGPHRLLLSGSPGEVGPIASDQFIVDPGPPPCTGDCDGDGVVTVSELLRGVRQLLSHLRTPCAAYPDEVTVAMLVDAVADALAGCQRPIAAD